MGVHGLSNHKQYISLIEYPNTYRVSVFNPLDLELRLMIGWSLSSRGKGMGRSAFALRLGKTAFGHHEAMTELDLADNEIDKQILWKHRSLLCSIK